MKFIKTHKKEVVLLVVAVVFLLFSLTTFAIMWFAGSSDKYGDRLAGIEKVELSDKYITDISDSIKKEQAYITKISYHLEGKLLSFFLTVKDDTTIDTVKKIDETIITKFKKDELKFYDIQVYVKDSGSNKESKYPIIGYKHKTRDVFVWSNN